MKRLITLCIGAALASVSGTAAAQQPPAAAPSTAPPRPQVPAATGAMLEVANRLAEAINAQDAAALQKMVADDAVYLDEDGHAPSVARWVTRLTSSAEGTAPKKIEITSTHSQMWEDTGWLSFNYAISETFKEQPKVVRGTATLVLRKNANGDWKIEMIHGALYQKVAGLTDVP